LKAKPRSVPIGRKHIKMKVSKIDIAITIALYLSILYVACCSAALAVRTIAKAVMGLF
jgi:hypothetical protein